jgi:predicted nucleic acid-binding protein
MVLVDTSAWIEFFRASSSFRLESHVELEDIVTCLPIVQEVLQGFDDQQAFHTAREAMYSFQVVESPLTSEVFDLAVDLFRSARRAGLTIRSSVDCLVAACALRNSLEILHRDRDFDALARIAPLQVRQF